MSHEVRGDVTSPGFLKAPGGAVAISRFAEAGIWEELIGRRGFGGVRRHGHLHVRSAARRGPARGPAPSGESGAGAVTGGSSGKAPPPRSPAWKDTAGSFLSGPGRLKVDCAPTLPVSLATLGFRSHRLLFFSCQHQKFLSTKMHMCIFIKKKNHKSCASCAREATS